MTYILIGIILFIIITAYIGISGNNKRKANNEHRLELINKKFNDENTFKCSFRLTGVQNMFIFAVDDKNKKILFIDSFVKKVIPFNKIMSVELIEDNTMILSKSLSRTLGGSIIGGIVAGNSGTVVGGLSGNQKQTKEVSMVKVKIRLREIKESSFEIKCFDVSTMTIEKKPINKKSFEWEYYLEGIRQAKEICDILSVVVDENEKNLTNANAVQNESSNKVEELAKLVEIKEKGLISDKDFEILKNDIISKNTSGTNNSNLKSTDARIVTSYEVPDDIITAIKEGHDLIAIQLYKNYNVCSVEEAKQYIEDLKHKMHI